LFCSTVDKNNTCKALFNLPTTNWWPYCILCFSLDKKSKKVFKRFEGILKRLQGQTHARGQWVGHPWYIECNASNIKQYKHH
jgi:hypothetical protein